MILVMMNTGLRMTMAIAESTRSTTRFSRRPTPESEYAAIGRGCSAAGPGEFSYRAVRNGRLDLARAEAIRDLIDARTAYQARVALAQAEGVRRFTDSKKRSSSAFQR